MMGSVDDYLAERCALLVLYQEPSSPSSSPSPMSSSAAAPLLPNAQYRTMALRAIAATAMTLQSQLLLMPNQVQEQGNQQPGPSVPPNHLNNTNNNTAAPSKPFVVTLHAQGRYTGPTGPLLVDTKSSSTASSSSLCGSAALLLSIQPPCLMVEVKTCLEAVIAIQQQQHIAKGQQLNNASTSTTSASPSSSEEEKQEEKQVVFTNVSWMVLPDSFAKGQVDGASTTTAPLLEGLQLQPVKQSQKRERE